MPALAERTKIRSEVGFEARTTTNWDPYFGNELKTSSFYLTIPTLGTAIAHGSVALQSVSYLPQPTEKAREILKRINHYRNLGTSWDNNNGAPPKIETINLASDFVAIADEYDLPFYFTAPGPNGEIVVEFKNGNKTAEIYFNEDSSQEMLLYLDNEQVYAGLNNILQLISHFR